MNIDINIEKFDFDYWTNRKISVLKVLIEQETIEDVSTLANMANVTYSHTWEIIMDFTKKEASNKKKSDNNDQPRMAKNIQRRQMSCEDAPTQENLELEYRYIGNFQLPSDCREMCIKVDGCCGQCAIAAILSTKVIDVFNAWEKIIIEFKHYTSQKEMKEILACMGYNAIQHSPGPNKIKIPEVDLAILRVSFGKPDQHWMITAQNSHYLGLKRMPDGELYIFDNLQMFDNKPTNGLWIEFTEYYKIMADEKMFITSYLEIKKQ